MDHARELEQFVYSVSHDLREPLRGIQTYARFLQEDSAAQLDATGVERLTAMTSACGRMERMIEALLQYSRLGGGVDVRPCELAPLVDEARHDLRDLLQRRRAIVEVGALPRVLCDRIRTIELLRALIENAAIYSTRERPRVRIGAEQGRIFVEDDGIGIEPRHHEAVFEMFRRLHGRDEYDGGIGAGLALARRIAEAHGGELTVDSASGEGSTFSFSMERAARD